MKVLVLYHDGCYDGFGAAWVASRKGEWGGDDVEFLPVRHGEEPPTLNGVDLVYLVDFSYPRETVLRMKRWARVIVLDHHKTAEKELEGLEDCYFDMERSGAMIAWDYFTGANMEAPVELIRYIQDRDLWRNELPGTREFTAALRSYPMDFEMWDGLAKTPALDLIEEGASILRYQEETVRIMAKEATAAEIAGHVVPIVNATSLFSEIGEYLLEMYPGAKFAVSYRMTLGNKVTFSLRSRSDFDVSEVARRFGGGGHAQAAGFVLPGLAAVQLISPFGAVERKMDA